MNKDTKTSQYSHSCNKTKYLFRGEFYSAYTFFFLEQCFTVLHCTRRDSTRLRPHYASILTLNYYYESISLLVVVLLLPRLCRRCLARQCIFQGTICILENRQTSQTAVTCPSRCKRDEMGSNTSGGNCVHKVSFHAAQLAVVWKKTEHKKRLIWQKICTIHFCYLTFYWPSVRSILNGIKIHRG